MRLGLTEPQTIKLLLFMHIRFMQIRQIPLRVLNASSAGNARGSRQARRRGLSFDYSLSLSLTLFFLYSIRRRGRESLAFYLRPFRVSTGDSYSRGVTQLREQTRGSSDCKGHGRIEIGFTAFLRMFAALSQSRL